MCSFSAPPGSPRSISTRSLPQFPPPQSTDPSPNPAETQAGWDVVTSTGHTPAPALSSMLLPHFVSCREFDSLSKDNVFENNRLVSPPDRWKPTRLCVLGGCMSEGRGLAGQELR